MKRNRHELILDALSSVELDGKRPTQLVMEIQRKFKEINLNTDESIIKSRLLSALPANIRAALVGHDNVPLMDYAKIADSMLAVAAPQSNPVGIGHFQDSSSACFNESSGQSRSNTIGAFGQQSSSNTRFERSHGNHNPRYQHSNTIRPFHRNQRSQICNAHIFYASKARTCRPWCKWSNKADQRILQEKEKTPVQSRPNSPLK